MDSTTQTQPRQWLMVTTDAGKHTRFKWLRRGAPGNLQTMREMKALVRRSLGLERGRMDAELYKFAHEILIAAGIRGHDWRAEIEALLAYTRQVTYVEDEAGGNDDIADARTVIKLGWGDCDDLAVLFATLAGLVGYQSEFKAARYHENIDGFEHVYLIVNTPGGAIAIDPTSPDAPAGWEAPGALDAVTLPIFVSGESVALAGFESLANTISSLVNQGAQIFASVTQGKRVSASAHAQLTAKWNDYVNQALTVVRTISGKLPGGVTAQDVSLAERLYNALDQFAAQSGDPDIQAQWADPNYSGAFQSDLAKYKSAVSGSAVSTGPLTPEVLPPLTGGAVAPGLSSAVNATVPAMSLDYVIETAQQHPLIAVFGAAVLAVAVTRALEARR